MQRRAEVGAVVFKQRGDAGQDWTSIQLFNKDLTSGVPQTEENDKHGLLTWVHQPLEKNEMLQKRRAVPQ